MLDSTDNDGVSIANDLNSEETGENTSSVEQPKKIEPIMMASFRVDREVWAKFGAIAKRERLTATDVLTDYIQRCTDNDKTEYAVRTDKDNALSIDTYDTDKFNEAVRMAVSTLSLLSKDDVSTMISTSAFQTNENTNRIDVLTMVSTGVDIELAQVKSQLDVFRSEIEALKKFDAID